MHRHILLIITAALCICGCTHTPPIGRELPRGPERHGVYFDQRVKSRFPVGSDESNLVAELRRERFNVISSPTRSSAKRDIGGIPCRRIWSISWTAEAGKITDVTGDYGETCL